MTSHPIAVANILRKLILDYRRDFGEAKRSDFEILLMDKLSDALDQKQKRWKMARLLQDLRKKGLIQPDGATKAARWKLRPDSESSEPFETRTIPHNHCLNAHNPAQSKAIRNPFISKSFQVLIPKCTPI